MIFKQDTGLHLRAFGYSFRSFIDCVACPPAVLLPLSLALSNAAAAQQPQMVDVPRFEVDPLWPKPLPNHWLIGSSVGVGVDANDHVFIVHRANTLNANTEIGAQADPPSGECCRAAPPVLEFDPAGNLVKAWGGPGPGYDWPLSNHGVSIDHQGNVWLGAWGSDEQRRDTHILKFTHDGRFLAQFGRVNAPLNSNSTESFGRATKIAFDAQTNEAYVSDGYSHRRVVVIDMNTGAFKRYWGAYGNKPDDTNPGPYNPDAPIAQQFRTPVHCVMVSRDGLVYVCDRRNTRIQVFRKDGTFVKEQRIAHRTLGDGSVWDIAFSHDPPQKYLYVADGKNERIYVVDRQSLEVLTSFGDGGRQPGQFFGVHSIATDSQGNIYTTETYEGKRVQKFAYKGTMRVPRGQHQGVVWPKQ
jgi:DNA-binding beta-propeller fold protein YncE